MMLLAQVPDPTGGGIAETIGTTGPVAAIMAILGFLFNKWLEKRRDDREGKKTERESESGIVETTSEALRIVREQMKEMANDIQRLKEENKEKDARIDELEKEVRQFREGRHRAGRGQAASG